MSRFRLDLRRAEGILRAPQPQFFDLMARICSIRGTRVRSGGKIHRSGLAKKKGGIGRHVTKVVKRTVSPNLQNKRIWVEELGQHVKLKISARALKTINKNGAFATLKKAGLL
jgi:large subunit ribosomal protein L28